jgi:hypothetical protein
MWKRYSKKIKPNIKQAYVWQSRFLDENKSEETKISLHIAKGKNLWKGDNIYALNIITPNFI